MEPIFVLLGAIIAVLAVFGVAITWYSVSINKKFDTLLEKGNIKDFKQILTNQKEKNDQLEKELKEAFARIKELEDFSLKAIQKTAVIRFDPGGDMGGKQSFCVALLDKENNGLVISSLFMHEKNRVYSKAIKNGGSEILLSQEEADAVKRAMNKK